MLLVGLFLNRLACIFHVLTEAAHGIAAGQSDHQHSERENRESFHRNSHQLKLRTSTKCPAIAAAAAIAGLTRWVRPPGPWRPSKLRFEVEAQRSPGMRMSGFMPRHIEQPASRHSNPAAVRFMCTRARRAIPRVAGSANDSGSGTRPVTGALWPGFTPQVTNGSMSSPRNLTTLSKVGP